MNSALEGDVFLFHIQGTVLQCNVRSLSMIES